MADLVTGVINGFFFDRIGAVIQEIRFSVSLFLVSRFFFLPKRPAAPSFPTQPKHIASLDPSLTQT